MKAKLATSFVFVLALALSLTTTARPGGKSLPRSASPAADRDGRSGDGDRDKDDRDKDDRKGDRDDPACRNSELLSTNQNAPLEVLGVVPIPGLAGIAFDINWADPVTERVYASDRTNKTLDIMDAEAHVVVGQVPGFVGLDTAGGGTTATNDKGPNGVVTVPGGYVLVGDGNSTLEVVSGLSIVQSISTNRAECDDGTNHYCERADEEGYDPADHLALILNDEPQSVTAPHGPIAPYGSWIDVSSFPFKVVGTFDFPGAGGAEQPVWDAAMQRFIITVPGNASPLQQSEIAIVKPYASSIQKVYKLGDMINSVDPIHGGNNCITANGLALGNNQHAVASACTGVVIFNALTGKLINFDYKDVAPGDEVWANNGDSRFYVAGADHPTVPPAAHPVSALGVFDQQSGLWLQDADAMGVRNPTAFAEQNVVIGEVGGDKVAVVPPAIPSICSQFGYVGSGCWVLFKHAGLDVDDK